MNGDWRHTGFGLRVDISLLAITHGPARSRPGIETKDLKYCYCESLDVLQSKVYLRFENF